MSADAQILSVYYLQREGFKTSGTFVSSPRDTVDHLKQWQSREGCAHRAPLVIQLKFAYPSGGRGHAEGLLGQLGCCLCVLALTGSGLVHRALREHSSGRKTQIRGSDMELLYIKRVLGFIRDSQVVFPAPPESEVMCHGPHQPLKTSLTVT